MSFRRESMRSVVTVAGELDVATAPQLDSFLHCMCFPVDGDVEIDAAGMSFCDCDGLSVLLRAGKRRRERGWRLTVKHPSASLRRLLALADADEFLHITDDPRSGGDHGDVPPPD
jgi:anti-anti-sigma factor